MRGLWQELLGLVLPDDCAGCGRAAVGLCRGCAGTLAGRGRGPRRVVPAPGGLPVWAALPYAGEVREALLAHKERGALWLAEPLGQALARAVRTAVAARAPAGGVTLVPVPSRPSVVRARGHDPVRRMARVAARRLRAAGHDVRTTALLRQLPGRADQAGLGVAQRWANMAGGVRVRSGGAPAGLTVVLVDDLVTTGASLAESARAVRVAGGRVAGAAVVAAAGGVFTGAPPGVRMDHTRDRRRRQDPEYSSERSGCR